jgi:hypothetical protein
LKYGEKLKDTSSEGGGITMDIFAVIIAFTNPVYYKVTNKNNISEGNVAARLAQTV